MSPRRKHHLTIAGIVSAATLVVASLGMLANGVVSLNARLGVGTTAQDSLFRNDSLFDARLRVVESDHKVKRRAALSTPPHSEGLVRRVFRLLF
jgi:hypothetical protein